MNKNELATIAADRVGISKKSAELVLNAALEAAAAALERGEKVQLSGFGVLEVKERKARVGRNPKTKEAMEIPASKTPAFKPSKALKDRVSK